MMLVNLSRNFETFFWVAETIIDAFLLCDREIPRFIYFQVDSTTPTSIPLQKQRVLPSHYRAARPVVIQPSRPSPSPTTLRRAGAASPSHLHPYTPSTSAQPVISILTAFFSSFHPFILWQFIFIVLVKICYLSAVPRRVVFFVLFGLSLLFELVPVIILPLCWIRLFVNTLSLR